MLIFAGLSVLFTIIYCIIIFYTVKGWKAIPTWKLPGNSPKNVMLTIIIPARNEEDNIRNTLDHIIAQDYPRHLVQIIVIDDHSEDRTSEIVKGYADFNVQLLPLGEYVKADEIQSFKKAAIETAMQFAEGELIVQTDADCMMGKLWLSNIVSYYSNHDVKMVTAPVNFHQENSLLEKFQSLDFIGMMGVTGAGIHYGFMRMCNGANMAYEKSVFEEVGGFSGNEDKASGDDMFLLHKVAEKYPNGIGFVKSKAATVFTEAKPTVRSFYSQRLRWATKNADYDDIKILMVNAIVFFTCFCFFTSLIFLFLAPKLMIGVALFILFGKGLADYIFLGMMSRFFGRKDLMKTFLPSLLMHNAYIFTIGMAANFVGSYEWKGRKVK